MQRVAITYGPRRGWVYVRALCGADEDSVDGTDTASAIALIDRVLVRVPGAVYGPGDAHALVAADRDRVLAAIYVREVGSKVTSSPVCASCKAAFDIDFDLSAIVGALVPEAAAPMRAGDGSYTTAAGTRFQLPTGEDELCAASSPSPRDELAARCHLGGPLDVEALAAAMEAAAPLVDIELDTSCAECGHPQSLHFDVQSFLLGWLVAERRQRMFEQHLLARSLRWSLTEILSLTRTQRRFHAELADRG
ncbi:MAG: hypothetical protein HOV81_19755 [Kofleriaceae bacterium]|nr:hypothetical protein [Kofleriaceae bacterium]